MKPSYRNVTKEPFADPLTTNYPILILYY